jgi:hypothetical protein
MPANNYLPDVLETTEAEHLATGFIFTDQLGEHERCYHRREHLSDRREGC